MAMRRPRIKPVANIQLNSKRKGKPTIDVKIVKAGESDKDDLQEFKEPKNIISTHEGKDIDLNVKRESLVSTAPNGDNLTSVTSSHIKNDIQIIEDEKQSTINIENVKNVEKEKESACYNEEELLSKKTFGEETKTLNDTNAFKCPPMVGIQRAISNISNGGIDDVFYSDIEENAQQMDLEKPQSNGYTASPSKNVTRQRIRPMPHFGQRRNSFVSSSPCHSITNEDSNACHNHNAINDYPQANPARREKHQMANPANNHSTHHLNHHTPHKYLPIGLTNSSMGRIRTESGCSVFSDTNVSYKSRKIEDNKQNSRKDFETRFHNGVPEKSTIKMSDLIYYNPSTNPMESKPNPSLKLEQLETPSSDIKPFSEKIEKGTSDLTDGEAVPVPQLKLNAKGELILDDKSLVIETTAEQEARKVLANSSLIYLDENTGMNGFYSRQKRTRDWVPSETIKFYRCLQNIGTDFSLMVSLFPNRTRRDLKLKFKKEERKNCNLINKALLYPKQFDIESLKQQLEDEEKLRDEQAKIIKEKSKKTKRKRISNTSVANRVLKQGDVYHNENEEKSKKIHKANSKKDKPGDLVKNKKEIGSNENNKTEKVDEKEYGEKLKQKKIKQRPKNIISKSINDNKTEKRKRRRTPNKGQKEEIIIIKEEIIKTENKQEHQQISSQRNYHDTQQLQTEIDELLDSDAIDMQYSNTSYETLTSNVFPDSSQVETFNERNTSPYPVQHNYIETSTEISKFEQKTFVNLDDGSVNIYSSINDDINYIMESPTTRSQSPHSISPSLKYTKESENIVESTSIHEMEANNDTCSSIISERELNEKDIQSILTELAEGSLVLVSTLDPDDPDKVLNEIYMVDKTTGDLCEEPLPIPDNIVQCILTVVS